MRLLLCLSLSCKTMRRQVHTRTRVVGRRRLQWKQRKWQDYARDLGSHANAASLVSLTVTFSFSGEIMARIKCPPHGPPPSCTSYTLHRSLGSRYWKSHSRRRTSRSSLLFELNLCERQTDSDVNEHHARKKKKTKKSKNKQIERSRK